MKRFLENVLIDALSFFAAVVFTISDWLDISLED